MNYVFFAKADAVTNYGGDARTVAISVEDVSKVYSSGAKPVEALRSANFSVAEGEFVSILGPSGCGKSTLLMIVAGLESATSGRAMLRGREVHSPSVDVGIVFQEPTLLPWKTTLDNITLPVRLLGKPMELYNDRARQLMDAVGLHGFADSRPGQLSGGMKQRAAICRALINDAPILLMDEPFSALDAITRDEMNELLLALWQQLNKTALFITHSIREAVFLSDRIIVMSARPSRIVADVRIPFPRPRDTSIQSEALFAELCRDLRTMIYPNEARERVLLPTTLFSRSDQNDGSSSTRTGKK
jgi:NitT/TauT family transport system ATP-binding protein